MKLEEHKKMEYRKLPHGEEQISVIGLGNSSLGGSGVEETERTVAMALENGIIWDRSRQDKDGEPKGGLFRRGKSRDK